MSTNAPHPDKLREIALRHTYNAHKHTSHVSGQDRAASAQALERWADEIERTATLNASLDLTVTDKNRHPHDY